MEAKAPKIVGPYDGKAGFLGSIGVRFMIDGNEAGRPFLLSGAPDVATGTCSPDAPPRAGGGRCLGMRYQAPQPVAHFLERRQRACTHP